jgi:8-oxo-dGTP diphosphatase
LGWFKKLRAIISMSETQRPVTEVAAGILLDAEGRYLLGQRPEGKPYAGYWEVPGGKIEKGETVFEALKRELQEELGIDIQSSEELTVLEHDYPHAYVRLHVSIIRDWTGTPKGCENQSLSWELLAAEKPSVEPLLPAAWPMLERLRSLLS